MHHCLEVQEILDLIFTQVYHDYPGRASRHDMISLALTCHYFAETSLDVLWHTQSNLVPLIKTLPNRCWEEEPNTGFERMFALTIAKPTDDEFRRFATYAQRIRRISYLPYPFHRERRWNDPHDPSYNPLLHQVSPIDNENYPLDLKALHILWTDRQDKSIPLFPNLLRVEFVSVSHARRCLDVVLQTKGISVSLQWSDSSDGNVTSLFPIIEQHALNMQELDLGPLQNFEKEDCVHLSHLVSKMTDLRRLSCASRVLDPYAIQHLASLPSLRSLQIANTSDQILHALRRDSLSDPPFPALHQLVMPGDDLINFTNLTKHLRPLQLQDISLHVSELQPKSNFHDMFEALEQASSRFSNVRRIILKYTPRHTYGRQRHEDSNIFPIVHIKMFTMKPLLSFTDLSVLELDVPCQINLGDNDIKAMADAWPSLKRLQLGSLGEWNLPHLITYNGFLHLLRSCPELEHLAFSFNAASEIPIPSRISPACINKRITYLYLGDSAIGANAPESVGRFIAQVLPKLCGIGGKWLARPPGGQQWEDVVNALKKFKDDGPL